MKRSILKTGIFIAATGVLLSVDPPTGWNKAGNEPGKYEMSIDKGSGQDGKNAATIKSLENEISGFGTLMQSCRPGKYLGKRVKMTGYMKSKDVSEWASFWLRVDHVDTTQPESVVISTVSFDNMEDRAITGTTDWTKCEIVLDVPANASSFSFGGMLIGTGQVWMDNLNFEIVNDSVPVTKPSIEMPGYTVEKSKYSKASFPTQPINLNFEE
jgi:hypothetical protein